MSSDLERWSPPTEPTSWAQARELAKLQAAQQRQDAIDHYADQREAERMAHIARMAKLEIDVIFGLGEHVVDRLEMLDAQRRSIAGNDPELNMLLMNVEMGCAGAAGRVARSFGT